MIKYKQKTIFPIPLSLRLKGSRASSFLHYFSNLLMSVESVFSNLALSFVLKEAKDCSEFGNFVITLIEQLKNKNNQNSETSKYKRPLYQIKKN
jgi:hypothetical protein